MQLGTYIRHPSASSIANHFVGSRHGPSITCPGLPIPEKLLIDQPIKIDHTNFRSIKYYGRETRRHFAVQSNLNTSLDLVLGLDQCIKQFIGMDDSLTVIGHQTNNCGVPLIHNLGESGRSRAHEDLANSIVELLNAY
jgi:hypothetical protein